MPILQLTGRVLDIYTAERKTIAYVALYHENKERCLKILLSRLQEVGADYIGAQFFCEYADGEITSIRVNKEVREAHIVATQQAIAEFLALGEE